MLVLSRRVGETVEIVVDGVTLATISVERIFGDKVRLGFAAHECVKIWRTEIMRRDDDAGTERTDPAHRAGATED